MSGLRVDDTQTSKQTTTKTWLQQF